MVPNPSAARWLEKKVHCLEAEARDAEATEKGLRRSLQKEAEGHRHLAKMVQQLSAELDSGRGSGASDRTLDHVSLTDASSWPRGTSAKRESISRRRANCMRHAIIEASGVCVSSS